MIKSKKPCGRVVHLADPSVSVFMVFMVRGIRNAIWNKAASRPRHYLQDAFSGKVAELSERKL